MIGAPLNPVERPDYIPALKKIKGLGKGAIP
jgi:hypothetical protein